MRFRGRVYRNGRFWLSEVPLLGALTQGRTRREALAMIADWVETMVDRPEFRAELHGSRGPDFEVGSTDTKALICLLLRRQRELSGLSLAQAAQRLGAKSRNAYARYEQGRSMPTVEKLGELLRAVMPGSDLVVQEAGMTGAGASGGSRR